MKGHALPDIEYASVGVDVSSGLNIHPNGDNSKCVSILGGTYSNGAAVDVALPIYLTVSLVSIVTGRPPRSGNGTMNP